MLDRKIPPPHRTIERPHFPWPQSEKLKEGIPFFVLNAGLQPIIKLELVFDSGVWHEPYNSVAYFTAKMLSEGTQHRSAQAIARYFDQYGAHFSIKVRFDTCSLSLVTLSKHLVPMLELLAELLLEPSFLEVRLDHLKLLKKQKLKVQEKKNSSVARKQLRKVLFGSSYPYGQQMTSRAISDITSAQLQRYYQDQLLAGCRVFVSGLINDQALQTIQQHLQLLPVKTPQLVSHDWSNPGPAHVQIPQKESLQTALCLGKVLEVKKHPDYLPLLFLNKLLGGYFGSRLMRNLREKKGYTYGVSSRIIPLRYASYLLVATEIIQGQTQAAIQEIEQEIKILQTVPVSAKELSTLQNYLLGNFLATVNDPFSIMEKFKLVYLHGLDMTYYEQLYEVVMHASAPQVMALANQYLSIDSLSQVVVG